MVIINKCDLVSDEELNHTLHVLQALNGTARQYQRLACNCDIGGIVAVALGLISGRRFDSFSTFCNILNVKYVLNQRVPRMSFSHVNGQCYYGSRTFAENPIPMTMRATAPEFHANREPNVLTLLRMETFKLFDSGIGIRISNKIQIRLIPIHVYGISIYIYRFVFYLTYKSR